MAKTQEEIEDIIKIAKTKMKKIKGSDLMNIEFPPIKWAVPNLIPEGLTILAGKPKHGKSLLAMNLALGIAKGTKVLNGIEVEQGAVLYLGLEDTNKRLNNRIKKMQSFLSSSDSIYFYCEFPSIDENGLYLLKYEIENIPNIKLIVIDTLKKFKSAKAPHGKQLYDIDYESISHIKQMADRFNIPILVIHHLRKSVSMDTMDNLSGSLGLTGAADTIIVLEKNQYEKHAILHLVGREVEEQQLDIKFDKALLEWQLIGDHTEEVLNDYQEIIISIIRNSKSPMTPTEISTNNIAVQNKLTLNIVKKQLKQLLEKTNYIHTLAGKYYYAKLSIE